MSKRQNNNNVNLSLCRSLLWFHPSPTAGTQCRRQVWCPFPLLSQTLTCMRGCAHRQRCHEVNKGPSLTHDSSEVLGGLSEILHSSLSNVCMWTHVHTHTYRDLCSLNFGRHTRILPWCHMKALHNHSPSQMTTLSGSLTWPRKFHAPNVIP